MDMKQVAKLLVVIFLLINTYWDMKKREILLWSIFLFGSLGVGLMLVFKTMTLSSGICGVFFGVAVIGCAYITRQAIGYGDGLVIAVCGVYLGFLQVFVMVFYALLICCSVSVALIAVKKCTYRTYVPFLPYLLAGYGCVILF